MPKKQSGVDVHFKTKECDKLISVSSKSQIIGEFLDWLQNERELTVCETNRNDDYVPCRLSIQTMLAEYFDIDLDAVERERRALLDGIRASHDSV